MKPFKLTLFLITFLSFIISFSVFAQEKDAEEEFAKNFISLFQRHDFDTIEAQLYPDFKNAVSRKGLEEISFYIPPEKPLNIKTIGHHTNDFISISKKKSRTSVITFQYEFSNKWLLTSVSLVKENDGKTFVRGVSANFIPDSLEKTSRFEFLGKGMGNYIFLIISAIVPLFIVYTLVLCIKTPIPKRKWLWIIFILFGFLAVTLNWNTEEINIRLGEFSLLGSGFFKGEYSPLMIKTSFPLGAIVFLLKRKKWLQCT